MIEELSITDLGVISSARIEPSPGLTVISGETGAGKTMVLTGLAMILGRKADPGAVRPGAQSATVEGRLVPPEAHPALATATDAGALLDEDALLVVRTIAAQGRSRAYLGGRSVPQGLLSEVGEQLVTVHGQADQLRLRSTAHQRRALDTFAGAEHLHMLRQYATAFTTCRDLEAELAGWDEQQADRERELQRLQHALAQIEEFAPEPGEEAQLRDEAERLGNVEELRVAAVVTSAVLSGDDGAEDSETVLTLLERAQRAVGAAESFDGELTSWAQRMNQAADLLSDLATDVAGYAARLEADPHRLDHVHERRARIATLAREHPHPHADADPEALSGVDPADALLAMAEHARERIGDLTAPGSGADALRTRLAEARRTRDDLAQAVGVARQRAAERMSATVDEELTGLAMPGAALQVQLQPRAEPASWGTEDVEFLLVAHPGAPARPLGKGASGGEMSRVMLALEVALAREQASSSDPLPAFVFDEVDAGVGGQAAVEVGRRLAELARHTQVIVVTHLAQVAAFAEKHLVVAKHTQDGADTVTNSDIRHVQGSQREAELARMLSGDTESKAAISHAADLLTRARVQR